MRIILEDFSILAFLCPITAPFKSFFLGNFGNIRWKSFVKFYCSVAVYQVNIYCQAKIMFAFSPFGVSNDFTRLGSSLGIQSILLRIGSKPFGYSKLQTQIIINPIDKF